jgi:hypothetical protein
MRGGSRMRRCLATLAWLLFASRLATATTVVPPTFEALVAEADAVFEGEVLDVRSQVVASGTSEAITTQVSFRVAKTHKGSPGPVTVLEFLGGTVGNRTFVVDGVPQFTIGDRDILFVNQHERLISPIVGFHYGRFKIAPGVGGAPRRVFGHHGGPLSMQMPAGAAAPRIALPMSVPDFEGAITSEIARQKGRGAR